MYCMAFPFTNTGLILEYDVELELIYCLENIKDKTN